MMSAKWLIVFATSAALFSACTQKVAGTVGSYNITKKELEARTEIVRVYGGETTSAAETAKIQLINAFTFAEILKLHGEEVSEQTLINEAERIQKATLMPEKLQQIKQIFNGDEASYRKIYVLPVYVERALYFDFFLSNPKIHAAATNAAKTFLDSATLSPKEFRALAKSQYFRFSVNPEEGLSQGKSKDLNEIQSKVSSQQQAMKNEEAQRWVNEVAKLLKPGQVFPQILDQKEELWVVRLLKSAKTKDKTEIYDFEGARFQKANFQEWLDAEKAKVKVEWN